MADSPFAQLPQSAANPASNAGEGNLYAAPRAAVTDIDSGTDIPLADRANRLLAAILDQMTWWLPLILVVMIAPGRMGPRQLFTVRGGFVLIIFVVVLVINLVLLARYGQTIGKRIMGIRIVRTDGSDAGLARLFFIRSLATTILTAVPYLGGAFALANALFIFRDDRRCIHDLMADTKVIKAVDI
jgi:uncharacterized RDD family membrane protein YckC